MLQKDLAKELQITQTKLQEVMQDNGIDPFTNTLTEEQTNQIRATFIAPEPTALPEQPPKTQPEPKKRERKKGTLAKKTTDSLENSMSSNAITGETLDTQLLNLAAIEGSIRGRKIAATRIAAMELSDSATMSEYLNYKGVKLTEIVRTDADNFDPLAIVKTATGLSPESVIETAGKFTADTEILEEIATAFPWNFS